MANHSRCSLCYGLAYIPDGNAAFQLEDREVINFSKVHRLPEFYPWSLETGKEREESLIQSGLKHEQTPEVYKETEQGLRSQLSSLSRSHNRPLPCSPPPTFTDYHTAG